MRYFKHKDGFKDGTLHIKCSDDGRYTWLVNKNGSEMKSTIYDLSYCLEYVKRGEYEEIFLDEVKGMKREIMTKSVIISLLVGKELSDAESIAIKNIDEVTQVYSDIGEVDVVISTLKDVTSIQIDKIKEKIERALALAPYKKVTEEESIDIWSSVDKWFENAPMANMFNDCKGITKRSIVEYLANQKGLTLSDLQ